MMQQTPEDRKTTRVIRRDWETMPAVNHNGAPTLIALRLGPYRFYLPKGMAIALADGLVDACEADKHTKWYVTRRGHRIE